MIERKAYEVRVIRAFQGYRRGDLVDLPKERLEWLERNGFVARRPKAIKKAKASE